MRISADEENEPLREDVGALPLTPTTSMVRNRGALAAALAAFALVIVIVAQLSRSGAKTEWITDAEGQPVVDVDVDVDARNGGDKDAAGLWKEDDYDDDNDDDERATEKRPNSNPTTTENGHPPQGKGDPEETNAPTELALPPAPTVAHTSPTTVTEQRLARMTLKDWNNKCAKPVTDRFEDVLTPFRNAVYSSAHSRTFIMPRFGSTKRNLLTPKRMADASFVFVHVNKAGGTFIKEDVFTPVAKEQQWDGVGFGTVAGWRQLLKGCTPDKRQSKDVYSMDDAFACGEKTYVTPCGAYGGGKCPTRLYWGRQAMGMCQLQPGKPCVTVLVLRDPVERMISQYNYVCVAGKEGEKKWLPSWKAHDKCPLSLMQFVGSTLTSTTSLIDRIVHSADESCAVDAALANLLHPCTRYLLLDRLKDGLQRLAEQWGPAMQPHLLKVIGAKPKNKVPLMERTVSQAHNPEILAALREKLRLDVELYQAAVRHYDAQWNRTLESCNDLSS